MQKQLIFAIDGAEWLLIQKWANEKKLPTFATLMKTGIHSELHGTSQHFPDNVWPSFYASTNPASFNRYYYVQYDQQTQNLQLLNDKYYEHDLDFRKILSQNNVAIGSMDTAKDYLISNLKGFQVVNWGCHGAKGEKCSHPKELIHELEEKFGLYPSTDCDAVPSTPNAQRQLLHNLLLSIERRTNIYEYLIQQKDCQVLLLGFSEAHCGGHQFWQHMDQFDQDEELSKALEKIYVAIDQSIGKLISLADTTKTSCLITSVHGMAPLCHASWNLDEILDLLGYGEKNRKTKQRKFAKVNPWLWLKITMPPSLQYFIKRLLPKKIQNELIFRWYAGKRNWKKRRAFTVPNNDSVGAIRINLKDRDRYGIVPQQEYQTICHEIANKLQQLTDPDSGKKIIRNITLSYEKYQGPFLDILPDITIEWESSFLWKKVVSPEFPPLIIKKQDNRTGSHSSRGFFIATGYEIKKSDKIPSTLDITPTILKQCGVDIPKNYEGRPLI